MTKGLSSFKRERFRIVKRKARKRAALGGFLCVCPPCFSGLSRATRALFVGHGGEPAFAADLATFGPHLAHNLLDDGQLDGFGGVRRQLFLRIDDNYFSRSTTITF